MGERTSGQDVRTANVMAVAAVANIVKSSLGPVGLDKVYILQLSQSIEHSGTQRTWVFVHPCIELELIGS
jgi:chaperonin GroEL (HSP60 family)